MQIYLKSVAIILGACCFFSSCKKVKGDNEKIVTPNQPVTGYMSTTAGSWWIYASTDGEVVKRHATGRDSLKSDLVYNYYETVDTVRQTTTPEYFGLNEGSFLTLIDLDGTQTNYMPAIVQKDSAKVGDTWTNTKSMNYSGIPADILIEGEVVAINQTMTVNGVVLTNITEVNNQIKAKALGAPYTKCGNARMWFSKGIGVVKTDFRINVLSFYTRNYSDSLISYHIEPE